MWCVKPTIFSLRSFKSMGSWPFGNYSSILTFTCMDACRLISFALWFMLLLYVLCYVFMSYADLRITLTSIWRGKKAHGISLPRCTIFTDSIPCQFSFQKISQNWLRNPYFWKISRVKKRFLLLLCLFIFSCPGHKWNLFSSLFNHLILVKSALSLKGQNWPGIFLLFLWFSTAITLSVSASRHSVKTICPTELSRGIWLLWLCIWQHNFGLHNSD